MQSLWQTLLDNIVFMMLLLPLIGAVLVLAASRLGIEVIRHTALTIALLTFLLSIVMVAEYDPQKTGPSGRPRTMQMLTSLQWLDVTASRSHKESTANSQGETKIPVIPEDRVSSCGGTNIRIAVGVDGISLWFVALTALLTIPAVVADRETDRQRPAGFYSLLLLLESGMLGLFSAVDFVFFYICLESTLLIVLFLIGRWGGSGRRPAVRKFFIYNLAGSLLIMLGLIWLVLVHTRMRSTENNPSPQLTFAMYQIIDGATLVRGDRPVVGIADLVKPGTAAQQYWRGMSPWIFLALFVGFAVKLPIFPFHTWMPGTNTEAPTAVSLLLMGVTLKVGLYGFVRILLPLFPSICLGGAGLLSMLAILGSIYAGLLALAQGDIKKLTAYASLSQLGLCAAGVFSLNKVAVVGSLLHALAHGLSVALILLLIGVLNRRYRTQEIEALTGLATAFPRFGFLFTLAALSFIGVPGLAGFSGESITLMGIFAGPFSASENWMGLLGGLAGCLLLSWAFLWLLQRAFHGSFRGPDVSSFFHGSSSSNPRQSGRPLSTDSNPTPITSAPFQQRSSHGPLVAGYQWAAGLTLAAMILWIGVAPEFFVGRIEPSVERVLSAYPTSVQTDAEQQTNNETSETILVSHR